MESNNYESFIISTVESFLPRFSSRKICLSMVIRLSWTDLGYDANDGNKKIRPERSFSKAFVVVFHRPSNYTKVLVKDISDERKSHFFMRSHVEIKMDQFSDHDSCWRSDGMTWMFDSFVKAWDFFKEYEVEGRDIDPHVGYDLSGDPKYFEIEMAKVDPRDDRCFEYNVKLGEEIPMKNISEYMQE